MDTTSVCDRDVMLVCSNGHVITERLHACPEQALGRCDRCGAATLDRCLTCGQEIPGVGFVSGLMTVGRARPPEHCALCGAAFPWTVVDGPLPADDPVVSLEMALRRLPRVTAALRTRHGERPAFTVRDEFDLEDLIRALLPLYVDDVRPESRTPAYAVATRTDFLLPAFRLAVVVKQTTTLARSVPVAEQWAEDLRYYTQRNYREVLGIVADSADVLPDVRELETAWAKNEGPVQLRVVILR